jgi:hypothetical protein
MTTIPPSPALCAGAGRLVGLLLWGWRLSHAHVGHVGGST